MLDLSGADLTYLVAGFALLLGLVVPTLVRQVAVSSPILLLGVGVALGLTPLADDVALDPEQNLPLIEHVSELAVIVALMGVGLALDRPLRLRDPRSVAAWSPTWRLLGVAMPLSIAGVALLGWWAGLALPTAILLGAVLAPTDPVLASDVQVAGPSVEDGREQTDRPSSDECSEVRFALTSEAGLNDGLAFPFLYLAVVVAAGQSFWAGAAEWVGFYTIGKVVIGVLVGVAVGMVLGRLGFRSTAESVRLADHGNPLLALATLLTAYGLAELAQGYGFLAVFACGMALRAVERHHHHQRGMHEMIERLELLLTLTVLLFVGMALGSGLLGALTWSGVTIGVLLVLVVRPVAGWLALSAFARPADLPGGLTWQERAAVAFFGVRGVGSIYYLAYGSGALATQAERWLWATVTFTIVLSVVVHGVLATPTMRWIESGDRSGR